MSNKNKVTFDNELKNELKKFGTKVCVSLASQVRDEMYKEAKYAIDAFYNDYSPVSYKRNYYNFKNNSFKKYYKNPHNSIIRGGVELSPYEMDDIYKIDTEYIFSLVYVGMHGNAVMFPHNVFVPHIMTPSPIEILLDKRDSLIKEVSSSFNDYKTKAINKASDESYSMIHF